MPEPHTSSARAATRLLLLVIGASLVLNLIPVWWGLPSPHGWAFDEIRPSHLERLSTWPPKYPPLHRHVLQLTRFPVRAWESLADLSRTDMDSYTRVFLVNRLVSVLMATAIVYLVYRAARTMLPRYPSVAAAATVAFMPPFVYYAKTANLDAPYLFWFSLSLLFLLKALQRYRLRDYILFATCGALSICTKDQAYGLYLLAGLPVVVALWQRAPRDLSTAARLRQALFGRALWLSALAALGVAFVSYRVFFGTKEILGHVAAATGPRTFSVVTETPSAPLARFVFSIEQVVFTLGVPLSLIALAGAVLAFRHRRLQTVALAALAIGYYAGFLIILPYQNVRYLLPVSIMGSLFVGAALAWLPWGVSTWPRRLLIAAVFAVALVRASSVDLMMLRDSRYAVESWLDERARPEETAGIGRQIMMPRNVAAVSFGTLLTDGCGFYSKRSPRFVVATKADLRDDREREVLDHLERGDAGYELVLSWRAPTLLRPQRLTRLLSNLDKVNPEILVFGRTDRRCLDIASLPDALEELRTGRDDVLRSRLAKAVTDWNLKERMLLEGDAGAIAYGLHFDRWTRGTSPAAVVVTNSGDSPARPALKVGVLAQPADLPVTALIDDGEQVGRFTLDSAGQVEAVTSPLLPGSSRLLLIWADHAWQPAGTDNRYLGVSVTAARMIPLAPSPSQTSGE